MKQLLDYWQAMFPNCEPVAHDLRAQFPHRWVRFHSLPDSKRYPEDEEEYVELLKRHNRILGELVVENRELILLTTSFSDSHHWDQPAKPWRSVPMHELEKDFSNPSYWHVFASNLTWREGVLDQLIRKVANDEIANVMIVDPHCKWLFHPYDGGMDVILESTKTRNQLKSSHVEWLSTRVDGL